MKLNFPSACFRKLNVIVLILCSQYTFAQSPHTITGHVTDASGKSLTSVTVNVKGKNRSTETNNNGDFSINADIGDLLVFTSVGYKKKEEKVRDQSKIDISLSTESRSLNPVVVTALGIRREKRSLGYSVTTVAGSSLTEARETNFVNGLEGKVAGVNVSNVATGPGGSANVVIRGISDITGSNQPLYVIDGIPMQNTTYTQTDVAGGYGGADGGAHADTYLPPTFGPDMKIIMIDK